MSTRSVVATALLVTAGVGGGYLAGARPRPAPVSRAPGPPVSPRALPAIPTAADARLRALQAELATCERARQESDGAERHARELLEGRERAHALSERHRGLASCLLFRDQVAPVVEQKLGALALTPDEERAARALPVPECGHVVVWSMMAASHRALCLGALDDLPEAELPDAGTGYREACEQHPIDERPLVRICRDRRDVMDALLAETWARRGLAGTPRLTADSGIRVYPPGFAPAP